jgi:glycine cleavage system regulatory protein
MRIDKSKLLKTVKKITAVTAAAILVNAMMLVTLDTYSWFVSKAQSNAIVRAAETDDLLDILEIVDVDDNHHDLINDIDDETILNPKYILAQGKDDTVYTIYFELSESINEFILHINPLYVNNQGEEQAYLNISLDPDEYNDIKAALAGNQNKPDEEPIKGTITVKYLNNYINKTVNVAFDRSFLLARDRETVQYLESKEAEIETLQMDLAKLNEEHIRLLEINKGLELDLVKSKKALEDQISDLNNEISAYSSKVKELEDSRVEEQPMEPVATEPVQAQPVETEDRVPVEGQPTEAMNNEPVVEQPTESESNMPIEQQPTESVGSTPAEEQAIEPEDNTAAEEPQTESTDNNSAEEQPTEPEDTAPVEQQPAEPLDNKPIEEAIIEPEKVDLPIDEPEEEVEEVNEENSEEPQIEQLSDNI